jgi:hypothetical protein
VQAAGGGGAGPAISFTRGIFPSYAPYEALPRAPSSESGRIAKKLPELLRERISEQHSSRPIFHRALGHSFHSITPVVSSAVVKVIGRTPNMTALLIGYAVAIAIVFFASRPFSVRRPRHKG